ncbi:hypothetical protein ABQE70_09965 [Xanthomonas campestris pv. campestris]|uniref:hypothetical protein n=1 Tax=Xanthomonas campestris TaxID=339 RepID=UPI000E325EA2|nr:hypothetical protein [Xanthomonas campestris]MEA9489884.1 hypothetical protein [Xanthomonas campestris]MEA9508279.1 hypothetical protein [Xanthomonas campestris]MEA9575028.1 hypothetical protein [Xanthomonas campestris]MEB2112018.1 hypothetical protein [Xanthomonas campestris pv. campestris]RFF70725.1 hypothetical protein D0A39_14380 [Xanthomonas campestris pv. campestris]
MSTLPPPLPPLASPPAAVAPARVSQCSPATVALLIVLGGVMTFGVVVLGVIAWIAVAGWSIFSEQAQAALQADAVVQQHIGKIDTMEVDVLATGAAPGGDEFVFSVTGDRGRGKVSATWVSDGAEREILTEGVLTMHDGSEYTLPAEQASDSDSETEIESAESFEEQT